jgi:ABC-type cobalamin/Fe3+-siderophores transport system ATPase subunit
MIDQITIKRFKRLADVTVPLGGTTLLIGANNSGKSSVLQALHFAVSLAQSARLVGEDLSWRSGNFELSFNPSQLIYAPVADVVTLATGGLLQEGAGSRVEITMTTDDGARCTVGLRRGRNRNIAVVIQGRELGEKLMSLENPYTIYAPGLAGIARTESFVSRGVVQRVVARGDANLVLRNVLLMLSRDDEAWASFLADMNSIFPGLRVTVGFDERTDEHISVSFTMTGAGWRSYPIDAAGTSILQTSQILAYIGLFRPKVLILDEPDSHLHPNNQRALCDLVFRLASERGFQALISTHSRHVLDAMRGRGKLVWLSKGQVVEQQDVKTTAVLLDLGALDSVDYFADDALKCVIATEDSDTEPLKALLWSNGFREDDTEIATYTGCSNVEAALVLGGFLKDRAPNLSLIVHRDSDYMSAAAGTAFSDRLSSVGITPFLTELSDVEGYFLNSEHLASCNAGLSVERAQQIIDEATEQTSTESIRSIVNHRTEQAFRNRRAGAGAPDHGEISTSAHADYEANPSQLRRGKRVIGRVAALLQAELGHNPSIFSPSPFLRSDSLRAIADAVWAEDESTPEAAN